MDTIADLKIRLTPLFEQYHIQKAILFGSLARGEATRRSDVDLILIQETKKRFWDRYDGILLDLGQAISGRAVDILIYTPKELEQIKDRVFICQALKEGITLYESDEEANSLLQPCPQENVHARRRRRGNCRCNPNV